MVVVLPKTLIIILLEIFNPLFVLRKGLSQEIKPYAFFGKKSKVEETLVHPVLQGSKKVPYNQRE